MVLIGLGVLYALPFFDPARRQEQETLRKMQEIEKQYQNDTYGGDTPEETLALFVDALKKGDTDLAAKYFVIDEQEKWKQDLSQIKEKGLLSVMIGDLERAELSKKESDRTFFVVVNENNEVTAQIVMKKSNLNKKWKIAEL